MLVGRLYNPPYFPRGLQLNHSSSWSLSIPSRSSCLRQGEGLVHLSYSTTSTMSDNTNLGDAVPQSAVFTAPNGNQYTIDVQLGTARYSPDSPEYKIWQSLFELQESLDKVKPVFEALSSGIPLTQGDTTKIVTFVKEVNAKVSVLSPANRSLRQVLFSLKPADA